MAVYRTGTPALANATKPLVESTVGQYMETVRPMHKQFIEPAKRHADVILPHDANVPAVDVLTTKVASVIAQLKRR